MAIGIISEGVGVTQAQYDQVLDQVMPNKQMPPGMLYHAAGPSEGGHCVVEVWESQEAAQQFFEQTLGPALQQAQITAPPRFFQVTNIMKR